MKVIIHANKDEMILAARAAQAGVGREERGDWPPDGLLLLSYGPEAAFGVKRNANSITVWSQQVKP